MKFRTDWINNPINQEKLQKFYSKIKKMADNEFGVDEDGDSSLEINLTDRTRYHRSYFAAVPYSDSKDNSDALEKTAFNLRVAFDEWETEQDIAYHQNKKGKET